MEKKLKYIAHYPNHIKEQAARLIENNKLGEYIKTKYPKKHTITTDKGLYDYVLGLKNEHMRKSQPLSKVVYDGKISELHAALGVNVYSARVQGGRLKTKNEIRIAPLFKSAPEEFLRMIAVHELAHLKEKEHDKACYALCKNMEPSYGQLEFDARLYLTHLEIFGEIY